MAAPAAASAAGAAGSGGMNWGVAAQTAGNVAGLISPSAMWFANKQGRKSRQFNEREAQKGRDFAERMRNTQYQATVQDMKNAGLNPLMMYGGSGGALSSSAGGNVASSSPVSAGKSGSLDTLNMLNAVEQNKILKASAEKAKYDASLAKYKTALENAINKELLKSSSTLAEKKILGGSAVGNMAGSAKGAIDLLTNPIKKGIEATKSKKTKKYSETKEYKNRWKPKGVN